MKVKTFDCVEMQHRGGARIREKTKGMTLREKVVFWRGRTALVHKRRRAGGK